MEVINTKNIEPKYIMGEQTVGLTVYPRIHMFTFDLSLISGVLKHGSMGYSLKNMPISISISLNNQAKEDVIVTGKSNVSLSGLDFKVDFNMLRKHIKSKDYYKVEVRASEYAKEHTGLGLSTQILGGIYLCSAKLSGVSLKINDLFALGIGHYSALGLNLLFNSGLLFEMGVKPAKAGAGVVVNPKLSAQPEAAANTVIKVDDFPFYTTVAIPNSAQSISGEYEIDFWNKSLPDKDDDSYRIVYNTFERIIPSIVEQDFSTLSAALNENIKLGSKPLEEGVQSDRTKEVLSDFREVFEFAAISSLGPSLYAFSEEDPMDRLQKINIKDYTVFVYDQHGNARRKINDGESVLIASFACLGKTTFVKNNPNIALDIESIHYARIYDNKHPDDEVAKGDKNWRQNPDYPANYVQEVLDNIGKYKVIFLTGGKDILSELDKLGVRYSILYPGKKRKNKVLNDAKKRGNDSKFIKFLDELLSTDDHRRSFESLHYERFEIIDDDRYIDEYLKENYYL